MWGFNAQVRDCALLDWSDYTIFELKNMKTTVQQYDHYNEFIIEKCKLL